VHPPGRARVNFLRTFLLGGGEFAEWEEKKVHPLEKILAMPMMARPLQTVGY